MIRIHCLLCAVIVIGPGLISAQSIDPDLYAGLQWRSLGPFRGGKATMVSGVPGNPAVYYIGTAGSGVWKTVDGGQVWTCVSDSVRLTGIGAVAVAPSRPDTVYVGASGGRAASGTLPLHRWRRAIGTSSRCRATRSTSIVIDPHNPDLVMAAAGRHRRDAHATDGGKTWKSVLPDAQVGGVWLVFDPDNPNNVYAGTRPSRRRWTRRRRRWRRPRRSAGDDACNRFADLSLERRRRHLEEDQPRTACRAATSEPSRWPWRPAPRAQRVYDYVAQGMFRSDDGGEHWTRASDDPRLIGGGQFHDVIVDPRDANILFATQTSLYRSTDAGKTWESYTGAPSGADFNYVWIDPTNDKYMILAVDQGTEISMDAGRTWTTWFNQPTGQMYNVTTDHGFPFFMYSAQQDSGTIATPIFGRGGQITYRDWYTTNGFETAHIVPDPADPNYLYATGWYGSILRVNKITGQTQHIFERTPKYRESGSPPMGFSPLDPKTFYLATQYLLATHDKGMHWEAASPDLTAGSRRGTATAPTAGRAGRGGGPAISALAFSPKDAKQIWAGTSNGLIQLTRDGGAHWNNVAPRDLSNRRVQCPSDGSLAQRPCPRVRRDWSGGGQVGGGGGRGGAYRRSAAHLPHRRLRQNWKLVNAGLPNSAAHAVREDPENRNLVFAALTPASSSRSMAATQWQSLRTEPARRLVPRPRDRAERSDRGDVRPRAVGDRRHQPACANWLRKRRKSSASNAYLFAPAPRCACSGTPTPTRR